MEHIISDLIKQTINNQNLIKNYEYGTVIQVKDSILVGIGLDSVELYEVVKIEQYECNWII